MNLDEIYKIYDVIQILSLDPTENLKKIKSILQQNNICTDFNTSNFSNLYLDFLFEKKIYSDYRLFILGQIPSIQKLLFDFSQNRTHPLNKREDKLFIETVTNKKFLLDHVVDYFFGYKTKKWNNRMEYTYPENKTKETYHFVREWGIDCVICLILDKVKTTKLSDNEFDNLIIQKLDNGFILKLKKNVFKQFKELYHN